MSWYIWSVARPACRPFRLLHGEQKWTAPTIKQFVSATKTKVYAVNAAGNLAILDIQNGGLLGELALNPTDRVFVNNQTDRIYVGTRTGIVQCLRESSAIWPTIHVTGLELAPGASERGYGTRRRGGRRGCNNNQTIRLQPRPRTTSRPTRNGSKPADDDPFGEKPADEPAEEPGEKPKSNPFEDGDAEWRDGREELNPCHGQLTVELWARKPVAWKAHTPNLRLFNGL